MSVLLVLLVCITSAPLTGLEFGFTAKAATEGYYIYTISDGEATITDVTDTTYNASLSVPDTLGGYLVTTIGTHAFYGCNDIDSLYFGNNITTFEERAFSNSIIESITIVTNLTTIAADAFYDCYYLENIEVNKYNPNFSSDEYGVLFNKDKTKLIKYTCGNTRKSYTIPDGVTTIGETSFHIGSYLESVTIPESVISINKEVFSSCNSLTNVYYGGTEEQWTETSIDSYNEPLTNATIHYNCCPVNESFVHSYTSEITTSATHLAEGIKTFTCSCGDSYTKIIAKLEDHTYCEKVTAPTCTTEGYTTFVCACGDTYKSDFVPATGHSDNNTDSLCDSCGENLNPNSDSSTNCSHLCHKDGFMGFIWKILCFFFKLLGSNKICTCGVAHY